MTSPEFVLTPRELEALWHQLRLGPLPYPLQFTSLGATLEENDQLRRETLTDFGVPDPRLVELLRLLAEHAVSVDAVAQLDRPIQAVAASDGTSAVLAVVHDDLVGVREIRATSLARSIVAVIPDNSAGTGNSLSVRMDALHAALALQENDDLDESSPWGAEELDDRAALRKAGLSGEDANFASELASNRLAGGQFGVTVGSGHVTERADTLITWFDTADGRYLMVSKDGWLSFAPTDNDRIATRVDSVLSALT